MNEPLPVRHNSFTAVNSSDIRFRRQFLLPPPSIPLPPINTTSSTTEARPKGQHRNTFFRPLRPKRAASVFESSSMEPSAKRQRIAAPNDARHSTKPTAPSGAKDIRFKGLQSIHQALDMVKDLLERIEPGIEDRKTGCRGMISSPHEQRPGLCESVNEVCNDRRSILGVYDGLVLVVDEIRRVEREWFDATKG